MYKIINEVHFEINGARIKFKKYMGQPVVTFADVDGAHGRVAGTAKRNFNKNKKRFIEGEDFFKITPYEFRTALGEKMDLRQQNDIILLTESGYLMLVKSFTDELSWQVQRQLIKGYFRAVQMQKEEIQKKDAEEEEDKYSVFNIPMLVRAIMGICEAVYLLKKDNEKLKEENKKLNERSQAYYKDIYFLKKEVKKLKEENREFNQICKQNQAKINFLKEDIKELKNENKKLNEKLKN